MRLGFTSHCEFTCDAACRSLIPNVFSKENAPQDGFLAVAAVANFHSRPCQAEGQMLTKEQCM